MLDEQDIIPSHLRLSLGRCPFCGRATQEAKFESLGEQHFVYTNDCACLQYAVLVVENDGCYYWAMINPAAQPKNEQVRANSDRWLSRNLDDIAPDWAKVQTRNLNDQALDTQSATEPPEAFDAQLYEEAQAILSMYG